MSGLLETLRVLFLLLTPQVLKKLLSVLQNLQESKWAGIEYCVILVVAGFLGAICETHTYFQLNNAGIKMKTALISAIYRKSLKMLQPNGMYLCFCFSASFCSAALKRKQSFKAYLHRLVGIAPI